MILNQGNPNQLYNYDIKTAPGRSFDPEEDREKIKIEIYTTPEIYESLNKYLEQQKCKQEIFMEMKPRINMKQFHWEGRRR